MTTLITGSDFWLFVGALVFYAGLLWVCTKDLRQ
jgi:hypothetical protein